MSIPHRQQDAPLPEAPQFKNIPVDDRDLFQLHPPGWNPEYNTTEWIAYKKTFENKDLWTVHEEERVAFEIKTTLVSAEEAGKFPVLKIPRIKIIVDDRLIAIEFYCPIRNPGAKHKLSSRIRLSTRRDDEVFHDRD